MFVPIGTYLTKTDTALTGSIDGLISAMTTAMAAPIAMAAVVYYAIQGLKLANGDQTPRENFVPQLIRVGTVIWLSSNLSGFNQWVTNIFFTGLPNTLATTIGNATSTSGVPAVANGVSATGAIFDGLWIAVWQVVGDVWMLANVSVTGMVAGICGFLTGIICGGGLVAMSVVYICARMVLATIICLAPAIIGCAMFDVTKPIFERAVGKVIALILMQSIGLIVLQILLMGDQWFMAQATTQILASVSNSSAFAEAMETLAALSIWFIAGAFTMWHVPAVAYSIGSGIVLSNPSALGLAMLARSGGGGGGGGGNDGPPPPPPPPNYSLSMNPPSLTGGEGGSGGGDASFNEGSSPTPITHSTRRQ